MTICKTTIEVREWLHNYMPQKIISCIYLTTSWFQIIFFNCKPFNHFWIRSKACVCHYCDVIMGMIASQITSLTTVYSTVCSGADQRKHQSSASLAFVWRIHRGPVNSPHKWPVTRKMFPFDDVIMVANSDGERHFWQTYTVGKVLVESLRTGDAYMRWGNVS